VVEDNNKSSELILVQAYLLKDPIEKLNFKAVVQL
jgi:hypothetical protein